MIAALRASLADRYEFGPQLGTGGMATVYRAHDRKHDRDVAIKVLHPEQTALVAASRFLQEIRVVAQLNHPNIVPLHDSGEAAGLLYYVMPCIEGESLRQRLEREHQLPVEDALGITRDIAEGLTYAHGLGVIHRDIKPENILLSRGHALLADFGIARAVVDAGSGTLTRTGTFVGTPLYTSPEQAAGLHEVDARADLYSLACVLYEMLAGEPPFTGPTQQAVLAKHALETRPSVRTLRDTVPRHVDAAVQRGLAKVPADRFTNVAEFAQALAGTGPGEATSPAARLRGRRTLVLAAAAAMVLVVAAFLLVSDGAPLRTVLARSSGPHYDGLPTWAAWSDIRPEDFWVFAATDSALLIHAVGTDSVYRYDGRRWNGLGIPDGLRLRPYRDALAAPRLLASRPYPDVRLQGHQYWWVDLSRPGAEPERLPDAGPGRVLPRAWSDGREVVLWANGIDRLEGNAWTRENTGSAGMLVALWGRDFAHRLAISRTAQDSVLVFDGISWQAHDILPERGGRDPHYVFGTALRDGSSVVLGEACDSAACEPLILQQDRFGEAWRRLALPAGNGLPLAEPVAGEEDCPATTFALEGAGGASARDYYVWGSWTRCERLPARRETDGCAPAWPCAWHVTNGRMAPVEEWRGRVLKGVHPAAGAWFALSEDGTLWRRVDARWRAVEKVPGLRDRRLAASAAVVVSAVGGRLSYEPSTSDTLSPSMVAPLRMPDANPRALAVRDTVIAILADDGTLFRTVCGVTADDSGEPSLNCPALRPLPGRADASSIAILSDGSVIGVVGTRAIRWDERGATPELLPARTARDTLWALGFADDGSLLAAGRRSLLRRHVDGTWSRMRSFPADAERARRFAVLLDGRVALAGQWLRVWEPGTEAGPVATLHEPWLGRGEISALHVLRDGRLVAGFANTGAPAAGGMIEVWAAPLRAGRSERIALPLGVNVTDLADDGSRLIVAGSGGTMSIPLGALPFAPSGRSR